MVQHEVVTPSHVEPQPAAASAPTRWENAAGRINQEGAGRGLDVSARMKIREGQLEGFRAQAAECIRQAKEKHSRILRYDWFLSQDETECEVREAHADSESLFAHHADTADAVTTLFANFADDHRVAVFGEPSPELVKRVEAGPRRGQAEWYRFLQGLEPEPGSSPRLTPSPGSKARLELTAHGTVRPGQLEGFKAQAAEIMRLTREKDTQTLRYDWFLRDDGTEWEVREAYLSEEGLIEHNVHVREARDKLFRDFADDHLMTVYGEASQQLIDLIKAHAGGVRWFSFLQGLEPSPTV